MKSIPAKKEVVARIKSTAVRKKAVSKKDASASVLPSRSAKVVSKKVTPAKRVSSSIKKLPQKKKVVVTEAVSKSKKAGKILIANKTFKALGPSKIVTKHTKPEVAIQSPYRFLMIRSVSLSTFSRLVGIFFVSFGGLFSLLQLEHIDSNAFHTAQQQVAQTSTALYDTSDTTLVTQISGTATIAEPDKVLVNEKPEAQILIENQGDLVGDISVAVIVPFAESVQLIVQNLDNGFTKSIGHAQRIDDRAWKRIWSTKDFPNGKYSIKTAIKNQYGEYVVKSLNTYIVANRIISSVATDSYSESTSTSTSSSVTSVSTATTSTDSQVLSTESVVLKIEEKSPLAGGVRFVAFDTKAEAVSIHARNQDTFVTYFVGSMSVSSDGSWKFDWDSKRAPDGKYAFFAKSKQGTFTRESLSVIRYIQNFNESTTSDVASSSESGIDEAIVTDDETELQPSIKMSLSKFDPLASFVEVSISVSSGNYVELYLKPKNALTSRFIGKAHGDTQNGWKYLWDTTQSPNGEYEIFARVKNEYGYTDSERKKVKVLNEISSSLTATQEKTIDSFVATNNFLIQEGVPDDLNADTEEVAIDIPKKVYIEPVVTFTESIEHELEADEDIEDINRMLESYREKLDDILHDYARAVRNDDAEKIENVLNDIEGLKSDLIANLPANIAKKELIDKINAYISKITFELKDLIEKNEKIIKDRIGDAVHTDSDEDGISDYDEVNLYQTNPFIADTDGDGYIDSAEITLGYDPHDSRSEAYIEYESAKEVGIVREDVFSVNSITTITEDETIEAADSKNKALISGKALPNSHVTIYIYSTPIVATIKTDSDGNWSYLFDKELEDGEHEVYVGITDNSGKIIAKSNPFAFVKTAQAFESVEPTTAAAFEGATPSLLNTNMMILVSSLAVVALGLVLIILGLYATDKKKTESIIQAA